MAIPPRSEGNPNRRFPSAGLMAGVLLLVNLAVLCMLVVNLRQSRRQAEEAAITTARNLTQVVVRDLHGTLEKIDLSLFALGQELTRQRAAGGIRGSEVNAYIARLFTRFPELSSIRMADAEGRIAFGIGVTPGSTFSVADRAYFQEARRNPKAGLLISEPVVGRISGQWVVILARRLDAPDGGFAGVAYAAITVDQLTQSMRLLDLGPHGTMTLRGADLGVYAKYPAVAALGNLTGRKEASPTFQALHQRGLTSGIYTARGGLDGVERTFSFMRIGEYPLIIHTGLASEDYLAHWRLEARWQGVFTGLFILLLSGLAWLLHRAWRRERQRATEELQMLRGLLPICANCKRIRDDAGHWNHLESYVSAHSAATFTHGVCPECAEALYSGISRRPPVT